MVEAEPDSVSIRPLSDARKEQIKLRATFLNGIGIGVMLIGVITPPIRTLYGDINTQAHPLWLVLVPLLALRWGSPYIG